jgi:TetR/AcrR family transcriptional regulator, regulator of biofilm formation and stress response
MGNTSRRSDPDRRARIIATTLDVIAARGVHGATYRTIGEAADVPLGSMTYHFPSRDDLVLAAFERFTDDLFSPLDTSTTGPDADEDPRERLVRMVIADDRDRQRDMVLLAELYVLAFREEHYAELMRQWMRRARAAITRHLPGVSAPVIDAVQEGLGLHRSLMPEDYTEDVVRRTLHALIPAPDTSAPGRSDPPPPEPDPRRSARGPWSDR